MKYKYNFGTKTKLTALGLMSILLICFGFYLFKGIAAWFDTNQIVFNRMITVELKKPIEIQERKVEIQQIVKEAENVKLDNLTDMEQYICEKWGPYDCKTAIAIARAESGLREDAVNVYNKNGTYDVGIFQINSIHQKKEGCSLKELVDAKANVDCAYEIYTESGWYAWSAFNSKAFVDQLK